MLDIWRTSKSSEPTKMLSSNSFLSHGPAWPPKAAFPPAQTAGYHGANNPSSIGPTLCESIQDNGPKYLPLNS